MDLGCAFGVGERCDGEFCGEAEICAECFLVFRSLVERRGMEERLKEWRGEDEGEGRG